MKMKIALVSCKFGKLFLSNQYIKQNPGGSTNALHIWYFSTASLCFQIITHVDVSLRDQLFVAKKLFHPIVVQVNHDFH